MKIHIDGHEIGVGCPPYIIAELSANHNGDLDRAFKIIKSASENGAHAIKIQTYSADTMTIDCDKQDFLIRGGLWDGYKLYDLYKEAETPFEWHKAIFDYAATVGITVFSTPFDESAVDLLESLNAPAYKIASFEATDIPLIKYVASKGKPMIVSTGMCTEEEIKEAVEAARDCGCQELILLHCISSYPTPIEQTNLRQMSLLADKFGCITGLSDHTLGTTAAVAAVALGASVIEKHYTLSRKDKGPDSEFSIEPEELKFLTQETLNAWSSLGRHGFARQEEENKNRKFRRSVYFVKDMSSGEVITDKHIRRIRPGFGIPPKHYDELIGRTVNTNVQRGTAVSWELINE